MPELPEVETVRADLQECLPGKKVLKLQILSEKSVQPSAGYFKKNLLGRKFINVDRLGKLLIFSLDQDFYLLIHLRMTGQLIYVGKGGLRAGGHSEHGRKEEVTAANLPNKHTRIILDLSDGAQIYFNDLRKFGYWRLVKETGLVEAKKPFGIEPLSKSFSLQTLTTILNNRRTAIKSLLLNQKFIAGLGNIYADEVLFAAKIMPSRLANSLKSEEIKKLHHEIQRIIKLAIELRGTTFSDYRDGQGRKGNFSNKLKVYGRDGEPCLNCGQKITKKKMFGRGTHFCEDCQK